MSESGTSFPDPPEYPKFTRRAGLGGAAALVLLLASCQGGNSQEGQYSALVDHGSHGMNMMFLPRADKPETGLAVVVFTPGFFTKNHEFPASLPLENLPFKKLMSQ